MKKRCLFIFLMILCTLSALYGQETGDVDMNNKINIVDALKIAQYVVGLEPSGFFPQYADTDASGSITIVDALIVAQYYVGLINHIPPGSPTPLSTPTVTPDPGTIIHVDNPFAGGKWYVEPDWSEKAAQSGGAAIAGYNTGIWLVSIRNLYEGMGVRGHLDAALEQNADVILFILYNIPNRSCNAKVSNGELWISENGFTKYTREFIDPIAAVFADEKYKDIKIVCIIEPESLPQLITCMDYPLCNEASGAGGYVDCLRYAINKLDPIPNVYKYLDMAYSGWLGWDSNTSPAVTLTTNTIKGTTRGVEAIDGFTTNIAGYTPLREPFLPDPGLILVPGQNKIASSDFYEWNSHFDELSFVKTLYKLFTDKGIPANIGFLIDTSRNGWGGVDRPVQVSTSLTVNDYVNESRIDRRFHRGNWCNQRGAGIGERPQADPEPGIDAYIWAKAPGYSDGISDAAMGIDMPNKRFDWMCDPEAKNIYCNCGTTGAIPAPYSWEWNEVHFQQLLNNAWPPIE